MDPELRVAPDRPDPANLRANAATEGYLLIRQLLPQKTVLALRREALQVLHRHRWLDPAFPVMQGVARTGFSCLRSNRQDQKDFFPSLEEYNKWSRAYADLIRLRQFQELAQHPALIAILETVFNGPVLTHGANSYHHYFPGDTSQPTVAHQDHLFFNGSPGM